MKRYLFFLACINSSIFCMFFYRYSRISHIRNLNTCSKKVYINQKQRSYLTSLFDTRTKILTEIKDTLKIPELDWQKFCNNFRNIQMYNELILLQQKRIERVTDVTVPYPIFNIIKIICKELGISDSVIDVYDVKNLLLLLRQYKNTTGKLFGISTYKIDPISFESIPLIGFNTDLVEHYKNKYKEQSQGLEYRIISHEISHILLNHSVLRTHLGSLIFTSSLKSFISKRDEIQENKIKYKKRINENKDSLRYNHSVDPNMEREVYPVFLKNKHNHDIKIHALLYDLDNHLEREADMLPLVISKKIFSEVFKYDPTYLDKDLFSQKKIPGLPWPHIEEIRNTVWND